MDLARSGRRRRDRHTKGDTSTSREARVGAWGTGPFENDDAMDFLGDLVDADDVPETLRQTFAGMDTEAYLDAPDAAAAIAGAALVAIRLDDSLAPDDAVIQEVLEKHQFDVPDDLRAAAAHALEAAMRPTDNEWFELWDEAGQISAVRDAVGAYRDVLLTES
ncbi:MAG: DUF4259 domain-containing protein [Actinomycetales bacterium]